MLRNEAEYFNRRRQGQKTENGSEHNQDDSKPLKPSGGSVKPENSAADNFCSDILRKWPVRAERLLPQMEQLLIRDIENMFEVAHLPIC